MAMNVVVDGLMTNYSKVGAGPVVVCLHGWGDSSATFAKLIDSLKEKYTVLTLDLPGFGATEKPPENWGIDDYAKFVSAWLTKVNTKDTKGIIGHSYGGAVAISGLSAGILKAKKLILLA